VWLSVGGLTYLNSQKTAALSSLLGLLNEDVADGEVPDGSIGRYIVLRRSGDASFDDAVRQAIYRAAPLHLAPNLNKNEEPVRRVDVQVVAR
jgi:hypothetical protein